MFTAATSPRSAPVLSDGKAIHRETGTTFYFATRLLPKRVRHATYVLYGFFRVADEVVDRPSELSRTVQHERLAALREKALGRRETEHSIVGSFSEIREQYGIPETEVDAFVDAMLTDIQRERYDTYEELEGYMRGSAAAVGAMMTHVMDPDELDAALPHAKSLGEAFQLTNFIRDVREDILDLGRIYLPRETLARYGVDERQIERLTFDENVAGAVHHEIRRAEALYRNGVAGISYLPRDCQFPVLLAAILYADYHRLIRKREFDVLSSTPSLTTRRKVWLTLRTYWEWRWTHDPEAVFARVSAVPFPSPDVFDGVPSLEQR